MRIAFLVATTLLAIPTIAAAQTAPAPVAVETDKSKEIICRREKETGSLVKAKKTCHSRAQWAYIDDVNQAQTRTMADDMRTRQGGN